MTGEIVVQEPAEYADWLQGGASVSPEAAGLKLFEQFRCATCHDNPANPRCPPLQGIFGRLIALNDGSTLTADESYLRESILDPTAKIVAGYQPVMPTYKGQLGEEGIFQPLLHENAGSIAAHLPGRVEVRHHRGGSRGASISDKTTSLFFRSLIQ